MPSLTAFLDTSVVLAGLASPTSGSAKLFVAARKNKLIPTLTSLVLQEAIRHFPKLNLNLSQLEGLLDDKIVTLVPDPPTKLIAKCHSLTPDHADSHVLAAAIQTKCNYLISLDQKHIVTSKVAQHLHPIKVYTPKSFWQSLS